MELHPGVPVRNLRVSAYDIPASSPESDGTLSWDQTTLVLVELEAGDVTGIGYTYGHEATAMVIHKTLAPLVLGKNVLDIPGIYREMVARIRNEGQCGIAMMAVSAVDVALWDTKGKLLSQPLCSLFGQSRECVPVYGSGGFTNYNDQQLGRQIESWLEAGIRAVKIKIGRESSRMMHRVRLSRDVMGPRCSFYVDANGAFTVEETREVFPVLEASRVEWFEEPVIAEDLAGLRQVRQQVNRSMRIAAGEYGYHPRYFLRMAEFGAVDVLQADATRCGGFSGFLEVAAISQAAGLPFSSHCAPALHLHAALCCPSFFSAEYFHDHLRIESMLFDGVPVPRDGLLFPDLSGAGMGLEFKKADAQRFLIRTF